MAIAWWECNYNNSHYAFPNLNTHVYSDWTSGGISHFKLYEINQMTRHYIQPPIAMLSKMDFTRQTLKIMQFQAIYQKKNRVPGQNYEPNH